METNLLPAATVLLMTVFLLWFRRFFLSLLKKRRPELPPRYTFKTPPDDRKPWDDLADSQGDTSFIPAEVFMAELHKKANGNSISAEKQQEFNRTSSKRSTRYLTTNRD